MRLFITLAAFFAFSSAFAQKTVTVKGAVRTEDGKFLSKASVFLVYPGSKDTLKTLTNSNGVYTFNNVRAGKTVIGISFTGYKRFLDAYDYTGMEGEEVNSDVVMSPGDITLEAVTVETSKIQIKEDTVSYKIDSTMYRKNDNVEQVLKNLPGVQVDKDGKVTAQGKEVTKVKVNGKEFFGGDVKTATRELNADMVDKIQIVDDYGDQAAFTGIKDGDPTKTLNIQLKKEKNKGYFGNLTAGGGTDSRYLFSGSVNRFNNSEQISLTGNINNTNTSNFNFSGLPGGMGAMAGSMIRSFGGGNSQFANFGNSDGVGVTKSIGTNYRKDLNSKVSVYGSYSFSEKTNTVLNQVDQQLIQKDSVLPNKQQTQDYSVTDNHRFSFNVEYKIDSFNYVKFNPGITYRKVNDSYRSDFNYYDTKGGIINNGVNTDANNSSAPNFNGSILFNHRFHKKGRTLSINMTGGKTQTDNEDDIYNTTQYYNNGVPVFNSLVDQQIIQDNNNHNYGVTASFNEQLSKTHALEFNYAFNKRFTGNDKETYNMGSGTKTLIDSLTNIYENNYTTNRIGANFRTTKKKFNYSVGLAVQPAEIKSNSLTTKQSSYTQHLVNYYPVIRYAYNFSKSKSFNLNYNGSTNQPTYQQSQPVFDYSNPQNITIGNPDLRPEFSNTISARYNNFDFISGNVFFGNLSASFTNDKIVNNVTSIYAKTVSPTNPLDTVKRFIRQETRYLNANGTYNVNAFYAISKPFHNRKYVFNLGGTINYNNNISYLDNAKNNGTNWLVSQRFSMDYKLKKWLEASGGANFTINDAKYSLTPTNNTTIRAWSLTQSARMFFKNDFILSYDLEKTINSGYASNVTSNPLIINATLEKQIFKKKNASFKLQGFDLLKQNTNVNRSVTAYSITDTRTNRLTRYFMLSFVFRFSKFDGSKGGAQMGGPGGGPGMMRMGGGGF